jgi:hypothetical protein
MTRFGLTGATAVALTLALAAPAIAENGHHAKGPMRGADAYAYAEHPDVYAYAEPRLPVENALRWGYSQGTHNYPSGWGGLYGDGRYPDNVVSAPSLRR